MSKKLQEKQARRLAAEQRKAAQKAAHRRGNLITIGIALVVVILVVALVLRDRQADEGPIGVAESRAGCTDVETYDDQGRDHVEEGTQVEYETTPPTSGSHYATPASPGFYTTPIPPESLVHNMEHGQLIIWYDPAAPAEVREDIEAFIEDNLAAILAAPYDQVPEGNFTITAWTAAMSCEQLSEAALADFRERYQGRGPENVGVPQFSG